MNSDELPNSPAQSPLNLSDGSEDTPAPPASSDPGDGWESAENAAPSENPSEPEDATPLMPLQMPSGSGYQEISISQPGTRLRSTGDKSAVSIDRSEKQTLTDEIEQLRQTRDQLQAQIAEAQATMGRLIQDGLSELERRKQELQISIEQLERRQERVRSEMRTTFAGSSQEIAIRVKSFKDYLVGSLQDLALAAEQLNLAVPAREPQRSAPPDAEPGRSRDPRPMDPAFQDQSKRIRSLLDQYRNRPDYYGPAWQLRRTFEPIHAERVSNWFFTQGGRGAVRTMGSRLQNILVASACISILYSLHDDRLRALILAQSPERLGEWRRGLQDCLGVTRSDFGPDRGVALFEDPFALAQKADRAAKDGFVPFIIIDETEEQVNLSVLQFPMWLAFAPNPQAQQNYTY